MKTQVFLDTYARRVPGREALVYEDTRVTYAEFERRTNQLAAGLPRAQSSRAGDRVLLFVDNGIAWPLLCVAAMKLGALVVPVSTRLTAHEVAFLVDDAKPRITVASDELRDIPSGPVVTVSDLEAAAAGASDAPWPVPHDSDDCLIGYTSGTSGTPKGAITTHNNLVLAAMINNYDYGDRARSHPRHDALRPPYARSRACTTSTCSRWGRR